jgi:hypothetical protein
MHRIICGVCCCTALLKNGTGYNQIGVQKMKCVTYWCEFVVSGKKMSPVIIGALTAQYTYTQRNIMYWRFVP